MIHAFNNRQRAGNARIALNSACRARGERPDDGAEAIIDLLADLRHYCAAHGIDFDACARIAADHFEAETEGGAA